MGARSATSSGGTDKDGIENVVNNRFGGAIFEQGTDEVQSAFKIAMKNHNQNITTRKFELQAFVDVINTADAYKLSRLNLHRFTHLMNILHIPAAEMFHSSQLSLATTTDEGILWFSSNQMSGNAEIIYLLVTTHALNFIRSHNRRLFGLSVKTLNVPRNGALSKQTNAKCSFTHPDDNEIRLVGIGDGFIFVLVSSGYAL
ncbi:Glutamate receptor 1 [Camponotus floridanus]|uniref:Glutamate receptor 1 n=1 Tax=Camponotus floridanus TaxID=104421 RepID=E2A6A8_CAMFO|nr:Glutamate receptor 1 [Camponotus floridanus]